MIIIFSVIAVIVAITNILLRCLMVPRRLLSVRTKVRLKVKMTPRLRVTWRRRMWQWGVTRNLWLEERLGRRAARRRRRRRM